MKKRGIALFFVLLVTLIPLLPTAACSRSGSADAAQTIAEWQENYTAGAFGIRSKKDPFVEFELSNGDSIRVELYPSVAPISVRNFLRYVEEGFYDGVVFHRIISCFMIQSGGFAEEDDKIILKEASYPAIKGEFASNGVRNDLSHTRGVISMARATAPDSATSQFFICSEISAENTEALDGRYAAFGRVIDEESMAAVLRLEKVRTGTAYLYYGTYPQLSSDVPVETVSVKKATALQVK